MEPFLRLTKHIVIGKNKNYNNTEGFRFEHFILL